MMSSIVVDDETLIEGRGISLAISLEFLTIAITASLGRWLYVSNHVNVLGALFLLFPIMFNCLACITSDALCQLVFRFPRSHSLHSLSLATMALLFPRSLSFLALAIARHNGAPSCCSERQSGLYRMRHPL
jgi:hypothetical protein